MEIACIFSESTTMCELQRKRKHRHEILKERKKKKKKKTKKEMKPQTLYFCTPTVIIKTVDAENESMHFLKKLNVATCPPTYV